MAIHSSILAWTMDMSLSKLQETGEDREAWSAAVHGLTESEMTEQQQQ